MPTREMPGASLFNVSSIFPKIENSTSENPVTLRPGRARLSTAPDAIGSLVNATTIGIERVNFVRIGMTRSPTITMTSGFSATRRPSPSPCCPLTNARRIEHFRPRTIPALPIPAGKPERRIEISAQSFEQRLQVHEGGRGQVAGAQGCQWRELDRVR